jgi:hypothetical protein
VPADEAALDEGVRNIDKVFLLGGEEAEADYVKKGV